jgi:hypothetical protein
MYINAHRSFFRCAIPVVYIYIYIYVLDVPSPLYTYIYIRCAIPVVYINIYIYIYICMYTTGMAHLKKRPMYIYDNISLNYFYNDMF